MKSQSNPSKLVSNSRSSPKRKAHYNIYFQNIGGKPNEKTVLNQNWINYVKMLKIDHIMLAETKLAQEKCHLLRGLKGYTKQVIPSQKVHKKYSSNGMALFIKDTVTAFTYPYRSDISNKFIFKTINMRDRTIIVGVYVPPLKSWNIQYSEPLRWHIINTIFRDLSIIITSAKLANLRIIIAGDFNSRLGILVGDHGVNILRHKFLSFIKCHNLRIINIEQAYGQLTQYSHSTGSSIVDYVIIDNNPGWGITHFINIKISKIKFLSDDGIPSDHQPIIIKLKVDRLKLDSLKSDSNTQHLSRYKIKYPRYTLKLIEDPIAITSAANSLAQKLQQNIHFQNLLRKLNDQNRTDSHIKNKRLINDIYNLFSFELNRSFITNHCFQRIPYSQSQPKSHRLEKRMQHLLQEYEHMLTHTPHSPNVQSIELELQIISNQIREHDQKKHVDIARKLRDDKMESKLQRHLRNEIQTEDVITYRGLDIFGTADILENAMRYFHELLGQRRVLFGHQHANLRINQILKTSKIHDHLPQNALYKHHELTEALRHFSNTKAKGTDNIGYFVLKTLSQNTLIHDTLMHIVNGILTHSITPNQLNHARLLMLRKRNYVKSFSDFRGITINNNLQSVIQYMRWKRIEDTVNQHIHPNQAAYRSGMCPETMVAALCTAINKKSTRNKRVYIAVTDIDKCFDNISRDGLLLRLDDVGVLGRTWRSIKYDMDNTTAVIQYNGINSELIAIRDNLPQGGSDSGPLANTYIKPTLQKVLQENVTECYSENVAMTTFADDVMNIAESMESLQKIVSCESEELKNWNLAVSASKSKVVKYARTLAQKKVFQNEKNLEVNNETVEWKNDKNILEFLGCKLNFGIRDFLSWHRKCKMNTFYGIKNELCFKGQIGGNMPLDIQRNMYKVSIRTAFVYGMKIIPFNKSQYDKVEMVQKTFLNSIIGLNQKSDAETIRMILGIPKLKHFIDRSKLLWYFDVVKGAQNTFTNILRENYNEILRKYKSNGFKIKGIPNQYAYITSDWFRVIDDWGFHEVDKEPIFLPTRKEWKDKVRKRWKEIYRKQLLHFLEGNGNVLARIFGYDNLIRKYWNHPYSGFLDEIKVICGGNISTNSIADKIKIILNCSKANYMALGGNGKIVQAKGDNRRICPLCGLKRYSNASHHLI